MMSNSSHSLASPYFYNIEIVRAEQWFGEDTILGIAIQDLNIKGELERGAWVALDRHGALTAYSGSEFDRLFKSCLPGLPNIEMGGNGVPLLGMRDTDTAERPPRVRSSALGAMLPKSRELLSSYAIIVIDDQATGLLLMQQYAAQVLPGDVTVKPFQDPDQALAAIMAKPPDLVITDLRMPSAEIGISFIAKVRAQVDLDMPILVVTVAEDRGSRIAALNAGATEFLHKPIDPTEFVVRCRNLLHLRERYVSASRRERWLETRVRSATLAAEAGEKEALAVLARVGEQNDASPWAHPLRVGLLSHALAKELGCTQEFCKTLEAAAQHHDLGKVGVPASLLRKPGPLAEEEWRVMRTHTIMGHRLLAECRSENLKMASVIARWHHERYDGKGYEGLHGEETPLEARIVAVADGVDTLLSQRPWRKAYAIDYVFDHVQKNRGSQFDPQCIDALLAKCVESVYTIRNLYPD